VSRSEPRSPGPRRSPLAAAAAAVADVAARPPPLAPWALFALAACAPPRTSAPPRANAGAAPAVFALASAEVGATAATVWARADVGPGGGELRLHAVVTEAGGAAEVARGSTPVGAATDFAGRLSFAALRPATAYAYRAWFAGPAGAGGARAGAFRTAPDAASARPVRFAWLGDVGGQNVCRDAAEGYPLFREVAREAPDFWIALGDMVYADGACAEAGAFGNRQIARPVGAARTPEEFFAHWRYNRADPASQALHGAAPYYAVWDDHEVTNDFGPASPDPFEPARPVAASLLPAGSRAFLAYNPVAAPGAGAGAPLYRSARWGRHLELFLLDARGRRDPNAAPDDGPAPKTMLGPEQRAWLEGAVRASDATWKVVVSSVPLSAPTGSSGERARDGWAGHRGPTGYERELGALLRSFARARVTGLVFVTTDVHYAQGLRYAPFGEYPDFVVHEVMAGPAAAGFFPVRELDPTFGPERLFFYAPEAARPRDFAEAKRWFNFGLAEIAADGALGLRIVNGFGRGVAALRLPPPARDPSSATAPAVVVP
jgi:alkaline phosphatase D